jgi:hypothetical protein
MSSTRPLGNRAYLALLDALSAVERFSERYGQLLDAVPGYRGPDRAVLDQAISTLRDIETNLRTGPFVGPLVRQRGAERGYGR